MLIPTLFLSLCSDSSTVLNRLCLWSPGECSCRLDFPSPGAMTTQERGESSMEARLRLVHLPIPAIIMVIGKTEYVFINFSTGFVQTCVTWSLLWSESMQSISQEKGKGEACWHLKILATMRAQNGSDKNELWFEEVDEGRGLVMGGPFNNIYWVLNVF